MKGSSRLVMLGVSTNTVRDYDATLTNRSVQRLRNQNRNQSFSNVALDNRDDKQVLLCESDDLVIEFDCNYKRGSGVPYWFVKQETKNMLSEECAKLYKLHRWHQV